MKKLVYSILVILFCYTFLKGQASNEYAIIPNPQESQFYGEKIYFDSYNILNKGSFENEINQLENLFSNKNIFIDANGLSFQIFLDKNYPWENEEAYLIEIDSSILLKAMTSKGIFYGIQTLKQLLVQEKNGYSFPKCKIIDWPSFQLRGFLHDTGRNFQSLNQLKEQLEILANYKYNLFHWHLTENEAWRLESKIFPELNSPEITTRGPGKFYTQRDFLEILNFCKERHIQVMPEFDIPGHSAAFRRALKIDSMNHPRAVVALKLLLGELMNLADSTDLPIIHLGTDEVRHSYEKMDAEKLKEIIDFVHENRRNTMVWRKGMEIPNDTQSFQQLWAMHPEEKDRKFIDSRANYINHLDPFSGMVRLFYLQPTLREKGDSLALGGTICAWPDNNVHDESDILKQNPIFPAIVFYSENIWKGKKANKMEYWSNLPSKYSSDFYDFKEFEEKVIKHRDKFFQGKDFPYVRQTDFEWSIIGPLDHQGDLIKKFPMEDTIQREYKINNQLFQWSKSHVGATIHFKHFFGFPAITNAQSGTFYAYTNLYSEVEKIQSFWIGFNGWSRSGGRRGGPSPNIGDWSITLPKVWVNNKEIAPPIWINPNLGVKTDLIPFTNEDYFYRNPTNIPLKKGWNKVLLKIPFAEPSWKWMFSFLPLEISDEGVRESKILMRSDLHPYSVYYYHKKKQFEEEKIEGNPIIFLGNSITEGANWKFFFPNNVILNRGISGDTSEGILDRLEEIISKNPTKIFILIGTNDLSRGILPIQIAKNLNQILAKIQEKLPYTEVYVESIFPINPTVGNRFSGHKKNQNLILETNDLIEKEAKKFNYTFLNFHKDFSNSKGFLKEDLTDDGLHLNSNGNQLWKDLIFNYVNN